MTTTTTTITIGSVTIETGDYALLRAAGWHSSAADNDGAIRRIARAISEGLTGESALFRAAALKDEELRAGGTAESARKEADARLHAARVERQAAILRARAAGVSAAEIEHIVR